jgi:cyclopropane fatty-acyl-phospholipid synthase-like methyltransferase
MSVRPPIYAHSDCRSREQDYRTVEGRFTKIASIEMLEAIGEKQFETYFAACDRLLAPDGRACIQTILVPTPAATATARRRTGSSATSSPAA